MHPVEDSKGKTNVHNCSPHLVAIEAELPTIIKLGSGSKCRNDPELERRQNSTALVSETGNTIRLEGHVYGYQEHQRDGKKGKGQPTKHNIALSKSKLLLYGYHHATQSGWQLTGITLNSRNVHWVHAFCANAKNLKAMDTFQCTFEYDETSLILMEFQQVCKTVHWIQLPFLHCRQLVLQQNPCRYSDIWVADTQLWNSPSRTSPFLTERVDYSS